MYIDFTMKLYFIRKSVFNISGIITRALASAKGSKLIYSTSKWFLSVGEIGAQFGGNAAKLCFECYFMSVLYFRLRLNFFKEH